MNYRIVAITASVALAFAGLFWAYFAWTGGSVVCSIPGYGRIIYKVRQIPLQPPLLNDGYAYRCEVWSNHVLVKASTYTQDSWKARHVSITPGDENVVFHLDGYNIVGPLSGISTPDGDWCGIGHQ